MTRDEVCAAARRIVHWHARFAPLFGRKEARAHSLDYVRGLMADQERKSVEPIALEFARNPQGGPANENEVVALQGFLRDSPWEAGDVFREIQAVFAEELGPSAKQSPIGTVGVIDESGVAKSGDQSVGVGVEWCGRLGKTTNCQVGVHLVGVTPAGFADLDAQRFLPDDWIDDKQRREKTRVPEEVGFQSKPQLAVEMLRSRRYGTTFPTRARRRRGRIWRWSPARESVWRSTSRTRRCTSAWRLASRGRGPVGIITWRWRRWPICT